MRSWTFVSAIYIFIWALLAPVAAVVLLANAAAALIVQALHLLGAVRNSPSPKLNTAPAPIARPTRRPFISVHVPAYDEPPEILARTLRALAAVDYPEFEVLVLDNNTPDSKTWRPIQKLCRELGPRFRFFHFDGVEGAKAGALNLCLELMHPMTRYVAVVDADYQVSRDFLSTAEQHLAAGEVSFVQFPQAYRNISDTCAGVELELSDYFLNFARQANASRSMLLTGTLSVIKANALKAVGGWSAATITEDAELGVRLLRAGKRGLYVHKAVGRGLLPLDLEGLKQQRDRWVAGNVQTLLRVRALFSPRGWRRGAVSVAAQLTAWPSFWLLPALTLISGPLLQPLVIWGEPWRALALHEAALTILFTALATGLRLGISALAWRRSPKGLGQALLVKLALIWTSSAAWLDSLKTLAFVRTPKAGDGKPARRLALDANVVAGALGGLAMLAYTAQGQLGMALASALIAATWPAALLVARSLQTYAEHQKARQRQQAQPAARPAA